MRNSWQEILNEDLRDLEMEVDRAMAEIKTLAKGAGCSPTQFRLKDGSYPYHSLMATKIQILAAQVAVNSS